MNLSKQWFIWLALLAHNASCSTEIHEPPIFTTKNGTPITIRNTELSDFEAIDDLRFRTFSNLYNFAPEKIESHKKKFNLLTNEEKEYFSEHQASMISLVVVHENVIVGFLSANKTEKPHELYIRHAVINTHFQKQGLLQVLIRRALQLMPEIKRIVCLTSSKNTDAQNLYIHFGGTRVENPSWIGHLYKMLNPTGYVGYEFDEVAIQNFRNSIP